jgi:hypothetical protein
VLDLVSTCEEADMLQKGLLLSVVVAALLLAPATSARADDPAELAQLRSATAQYHRTTVAEDDGYHLVPGLDHCFNRPGVGAMGYHYINVDLLDLALDANAPEAMVYAPGVQGQLHLAAVEYIVPAAAWDDAGNVEPPTVLGRHLHLNEALGVYVLHAWVWRHNPAGIFEDWNPEVSCP